MYGPANLALPALRGSGKSLRCSSNSAESGLMLIADVLHRRKGDPIVGLVVGESNGCDSESAGTGWRSLR
jgi:hypothetical protein